MLVHSSMLFKLSLNFCTGSSKSALVVIIDCTSCEVGSLHSEVHFDHLGQLVFFISLPFFLCNYTSSITICSNGSSATDHCVTLVIEEGLRGRSVA